MKTNGERRTEEEEKRKKKDKERRKRKTKAQRKNEKRRIVKRGRTEGVEVGEDERRFMGDAFHSALPRC